jgi:alpha-amylase/alpha-mannosidase (GH57 family)
MITHRYVCIHGHFYQPVRENPWTGETELQPDAYPFHDWNERISSECYGANAWSQIRDGKGIAADIVNNYTRISYNFGPTLLVWLEAHAPHVYQAVIAADAASAKRYSGHGSAFAQCYNHIIMPLADRRDKITQIVWGQRDFEHRFGRAPQGMWLPETAVDLESLDLLAERGVHFTVLAPHQITATRALGTGVWTDVSEETIDSRHPYLIRLSSGRSITVFVYNGPVARAVAFEKLLDSGDDFAQRLLGAFSSTHADAPELSHIATDGESYGHHHKFGDMALAYALHLLERHSGVRLTNYSEYLSKHPAQHEARLKECSSWSCAHGVERWRSDCGCKTRTEPGWNQKWRAPLREALDWLRDEIAPVYERKMSQLVHDPWAARDAGIDLLLSSGKEIERSFFDRHAAKRLTPAGKKTVIELLRMQRHLMLMFSSCGWFFDDISGLESKMILQQAARVIDLARAHLKIDPEPHFLKILAAARSNRPEMGSGADVYRRQSEPYRKTTAPTTDSR